VEENDEVNGIEKIIKKKNLKKCWIKDGTLDNAGEAEVKEKEVDQQRLNRLC
jgi:hypothetical protein